MRASTDRVLTTRVGALPGPHNPLEPALASKARWARKSASLPSVRGGEQGLRAS